MKSRQRNVGQAPIQITSTCQTSVHVRSRQDLTPTMKTTSPSATGHDAIDHLQKITHAIERGERLDTLLIPSRRKIYRDVANARRATPRTPMTTSRKEDESREEAPPLTKGHEKRKRDRVDFIQTINTSREDGGQ